jgi:hypothetical protein
MAVNSSSSEVVGKSPGATPATLLPGTYQGAPGNLDKTNVLSGYRSFNYVFTFAALSTLEVNEPLNYRNRTLNLVIIKSGGKGPNALGSWLPPSSPGYYDLYIEDVEINSIMGFSEETSVSQPTGISFDVIEPYSMNGFLEALQVSAVKAGYSTYQNASYVLKMEFLGYPDSTDLGSPQPIPNSTRYFPVKITGMEISVDQRGTRYKVTAIPFNEAGFGMPSRLKKSVKISGEKVKDILTDLAKNINKQTVQADEDARGGPAPGHDVYSISFQGKAGLAIGETKVSEFLKDNSTYKFPDLKKVEKPTAYQQKPTPSSEQNASDPNSYKPTYIKDVTAQFSEGKNITECIAAIIRDSKFGRKLIEDLAHNFNSVVDQYGRVDYFLIKLEVTNQSKNNPDTKRPYQNFNFVVSMHKIMHNRIPLFGNQQVNAEQLEQLALREYNYIYTGKNVDILNFKLNFNSLYFEAIPAALGKSYGPAARDVAGYNNKPEPKLGGDPSPSTSNLPLEVPKYKDNQLTSVDKDSGGQRQSDPYASLAKGMHRAIIDSKASMLDGDLEILGDPFFIVTGGIGNYNAGSGPVSDEGSANQNYGEIMIMIKFRNPIDINGFEQGGLLRFNPELIPFSGVYRVLEAKSSFKDGVFKQTLKILRVPGQGAASSTPSLFQKKDPLDNASRNSSPIAPAAAGGTSGGVPGGAGGTGGVRISDANLLNQLGRGNPSPEDNFTAAKGGLGGEVTAGNSQVSGATDNLVGNTRGAYQPYGGVVPDATSQYAQGIPIQASAISGLQEKTLSSEALVYQSSNTLGDSFGVSNAGSNVTNQIVERSNSIINQVSVPGSGIGVGATVSYTPATPITDIIRSGNNVTTEDIRSQAASLPTNVQSISAAASNVGLPTLSAVASLGANSAASLNSAISNATSAVTVNNVNAALNNANLTVNNLGATYIASVNNISASALSEVRNIGNRSADLVNNIGSSALAVTRGTANDLLAIGLQFGINPVQLSGLSNALKSRMIDQLNAITSKIPADTKIAIARAQGVNFNSLTLNGIAKLPPTPAYYIAPDPKPDTGYINQVAAAGGPSAVARSYGTNNIADVSQNQLPADVAQSVINSTPAYIANPFSPLLQPNVISAAIIGNKFLNVKSQLSAVTGAISSVEADLNKINDKFGVGNNVTNSVVSKFGSITKNLSPLDKIMLR